MNINKGEQFLVPFDVRVNDAVATPESIDGLRIKIEDRLCEYHDGELEYDDESEVWLYPLTEAQSMTMTTGTRKAQVAVKIGNTILKTDVLNVNVADTIIKERWF